MDKEENRKAEVLYFLLMAQLIVQVFSFIAVVFVFYNKLFAFVFSCFQTLVILISLVLLKYGKLRLSGFLYISLLWIDSVIVLYFGKGTESSILFFFFSLSVSTAIIYSLGWSVLFSLVNSLLVLGIAILENRGYPFPDLFPEPPMSRWVTFSLFLFLTVSPVYIILRNLRRSLTEEKETRDSKKRVEKDLAESKRRFHEVAENIPGLVFTVKINGNGNVEFIYSSQYDRMASLFKALPGTPEYKSLGTNLHPEDRDSFIKAIHKAAEYKENLSFTGRWLDEDEEIHWGQMSASVEKQEDYIILNGVLLDITEQKKLQERFLQSQKMESLGRLAGGVAHDFNNFLVPVSGYIELAMKEIPEDSEAYTYLQTSLDSVYKAAKLTDQILSFSRKNKIKWEWIDVNESILQFQPHFIPLLKDNISLKLKLEKGIKPIKADKNQLEQLLMNLVTNARDAMSHGGEIIIQTKEIYIDKQHAEGRAIHEGPYIQLIVKDTGCGMDSKTLENIFEPFYTTKRIGFGTGLGMAIVRSLVEQNRGHIEINSKPGKGTVMNIYFSLSFSEF